MSSAVDSIDESASVKTEQPNAAGMEAKKEETSSAPSSPAVEPKVEKADKPLIGIDFGTKKIVVGVSKSAGKYPAIVRNELSEWQTANLVAFNGEERLIGENALGRALVAPQAAISEISRVLGRDFEASKTLTLPYELELSPGGGTAIKVPYGSGKVSFCPEQIAAMILRRLQDYLDVSIEAKGLNLRDCFLSVPGVYNTKQRQAFIDSALIAGFNVIGVVADHTASVTDYALKHPLSEGEAAKHVVIVDVGASTTSISLACYEPKKAKVEAALHEEFGGMDFDAALFEHCAKLCRDTHKVDIAPLTSSAAYTTSAIRNRVRLLRACEKAKQVLSTVTDAEVVLPTSEKDITIPITLALFESLCAPLASKLAAVIQKFLEIPAVASLRAQISSVEVIGGGARVKLVMATLAKEFAIPLAHTLDSASTIALGTAAFGALQVVEKKDIVIEDPFFELAVIKPSTEEFVASLKGKEAEMLATDAAVHAKAKARNDLEAVVFARKDNLSDPAFNSYFIDKAKKENFSDKLVSIGNWLEETVGDASVTIEEYTQKMDELLASGKENVPELFKRLEDIEKEKEKAQQEAFVKATLNAAAGSSHAHDEKKKPKSNKQKLDAAIEAKESGNKHFVDLNFPDAVRRYTQALEHIMSMYDSNEEQLKESKQVKLSCYLNLSQCYLKIEAFSKCIENAKAALELDPDNTKALFRRAQALFATKEYELAKADVAKGLKLLPESKDFKGLQVKVQKMVDAEKAKQKKVFAAMFGSDDKQ